MNQEKPYNYSAEDIQRYLDGRMTPEEMHALEKSALEDPFLADAIEGYREVEHNYESDLAELKSRIYEEKSKRAAYVNWSAMLAAAVLMICFSFGSWLLFRQENVPTQIAKNEAPVEHKKEAAPQEQPVLLSPDSQVLQNSVVRTQPKVQKEATVADLKPIDTVKPELSEMASVRDDAARPGELKADTTKVAAAAPVVAPPELNREKEVLTAAANSKKKSLKAGAPIAARSEGYEGRSSSQPILQMPEPVTGWRAFIQYVSDSLRRPTGAHADLHGGVAVSFDVESTGNLSNFKVETPLHPEYDKEAIRVIKAGPKWKSSSRGTVRTGYTIIF